MTTQTDPGNVPFRAAGWLLTVTAGGAASSIFYLYGINPALPTLPQAAALGTVFLAAAGIFYAAWMRARAVRAAPVLFFILISAAWGAVAVSLFPRFPKLPEMQTITIQTLADKNPRSQGRRAAVVFLHSDIPPHSQARFTAQGAWQPYEEGFALQDGEEAQLIWRGRVLRSGTVGLEASPEGGMILIDWGRGEPEEVDLYADSLRVITASREFQTPFLSKVFVVGSLWLVFSLLVFAFLAALFPSPLIPHPVLESRTAFRWAGWVGLAAASLDIFENSGLLRDYPLRDSSVFLYSGQNILAGGIPYLEVWDHKGPLIYAINALGLWIGNGSRLGVLVVEVLFVLGIFAALYRGVEKVWGAWPAFGAAAVLLAGFDLLYDGGNLTEEYALLFQTLSILGMLAWLQRPSGRRAAVIGLLAAAGFLLRPNLVSTQLLTGAILLLESLRREQKDCPKVWQTLAALAGGFLAPVLVVALFFAAHHALPALFDQMITYNLLYSRYSGLSTGEHMLIPWSVLKRLWITPVGIAGLFIGMRGAWKEKDLLVRRMLLLGCLDLVAGLFIYNVSGRGFRHYFLNILPAAALLSAYLLWKLSRRAEPLCKRMTKHQAGKSLFIFSMAVWTGISLAFYLPEFAGKLRTAAAPPEKCGYLDETINEEDTVLMWGIETPFYITTGRRSPTRYIYQTPLVQPWYGTTHMGQELIAALEREKTPVIVDTSPTNSEFPPLTPAASPDSFAEAGAVAVIREYVARQYRLEGSLPCFTGEWKLYRRLP